MRRRKDAERIRDEVEPAERWAGWVVFTVGLLVAASLVGAGCLIARVVG